jgi:hypothetical protein
LQITDKDVISYLSTQIEIDEILATTASGGETSLVLCSKTALAVVQAAAVIIQSDLGSTAAELLMKAFNSQNISH